MGTIWLRYTRNVSEANCEPSTKRFLLFLLVLSLITVGCGSYASQAEEVTGPFVRSSLQEYAKAMQKTEKTLQSFQPPPEDKQRHEQAVEVLSQAQQLVQEAGEEGVSRQEAPELAQRLRGFGEELKT